MIICVLDKTLEYENNKDILDTMFNEINDIVSDTNLIFSHLIIDGLEVYNDYYDYFLDNIRNIEEVTVVTKTVKKMSEEILLSTVDYLERAIPEIEILSNEFYKTPSRESWKKLMDLIEGIKWIMDTFAAIDYNEQLKNIVNSYEEWNIYAKDIYELNELIIEFEEILENSDFVSTADILSYEIIPLFNNMKEKLLKLISEEVEINDID
ncbi:conserved hypothetical protein [[Clostridium] ultunense Esp]|uniref:Uncharacterized protein n=1 Tax=[Clostridium] ultunense Esp TaxID=1288971 RepID=M1ZK13_9FIRM|nr:hypothetical protein [Schnuerera ultunensis]CCQ94652.1 conserved hypothetical protein [[Clostridium] ultunense Esp]SHD76646.1 conserved protein of unknown function [[Clostridium] ultunense Esp]